MRLTPISDHLPCSLLTADVLRDIVVKVNPSALDNEGLAWLHAAEDDARMLKTDLLEALRFVK
jgi:hypothetical protein